MSGEGPTCEQCRHWEANQMRSYRIDGGLEKQAPCRIDYPAVVASPMKWAWQKCARFAPELRPYPKEAA